jgi:hypothetical protein
LADRFAIATLKFNRTGLPASDLALFGKFHFHFLVVVVRDFE